MRYHFVRYIKNKFSNIKDSPTFTQSTFSYTSTFPLNCVFSLSLYFSLITPSGILLGEILWRQEKKADIEHPSNCIVTIQVCRYTGADVRFSQRISHKVAQSYLPRLIADPCYQKKEEEGINGKIGILHNVHMW